MKKAVVGIVGIGALVFLGFLIFWDKGEQTTFPQENATSTQEESRDPQSNGSIVETSDIRVMSPRRGATVTSPLTIRGEARGPWYFEASFSGRLLDSAGRTVVQFPVEALGEWMTTDFVPFEATINWDTQVSGSGTLLLENANASGLPEHAKSISIPIIFGGLSSSQTVGVYFSRSSVTDDCSDVFRVTRTVADTQAVARAALLALFAGPTRTEVDQGYVTNIPTGVNIQSLRVENGTAYVDLSEDIEEGVGGSCRVTAIRAQITETLKQFSTVDDVVISINGRTEDILQP